MTTAYRTAWEDGRVWERFAHRPGDIVIATWPKCGTTWMQRIVSLLVFRDTSPMTLDDVAPWLDWRVGPMDALFPTLEAQTHRRFLKTHQPADGLPMRDDVFYVHVGRDGRDACLSWHNHMAKLPKERHALYAKIGREDPDLPDTPPPLDDPADTFHRWLTEGVWPGMDDGAPVTSFFHHAKVWWEMRDRPNVRLIHFADLKADLVGEMAGLARFLGIEIGDDELLTLAEAAGFEAMRRDGDALMAGTAVKGGAQGFLNKGDGGRWKGDFREADLALYDEKLAALPGDCAAWVSGGRTKADPEA